MPPDLTGRGRRPANTGAMCAADEPECRAARQSHARYSIALATSPVGVSVHSPRSRSGPLRVVRWRRCPSGRPHAGVLRSRRHGARQIRALASSVRGHHLRACHYRHQWSVPGRAPRARGDPCSAIRDLGPFLPPGVSARKPLGDASRSVCISRQLLRATGLQCRIQYPQCGMTGHDAGAAFRFGHGGSDINCTP